MEVREELKEIIEKAKEAAIAAGELPEGDYDTIAGLVTDLLGRIPKENEHPSVQVCGLTITVLEIEDQRLSRLLIVKNDPRRTPEEETHED